MWRTLATNTFSQCLVPQEIWQRRRFYLSCVILTTSNKPLQTYPALFGLYKLGYLPDDIHIIGYARTKMDEAEYYKRITSYIKNPNDDPDISEKIEEFKSISSYVAGSYDDDDGFKELNSHLEKIESNYRRRGRNRVFYLALPPSVFTSVSKGIKRNAYVANGVNRMVVEKPFGKDLQSSRELMGALKEDWSEEETFRIDHYLGKEMVKNMLVLRFANIAMGSSWDKNWISNVQITFKEPFGTEGRGGYFDEFGIIRDVLQNREHVHLLRGFWNAWLTCSFVRLAASPKHPYHGATCLFLCGGYSGREGLYIILLPRACFLTWIK